ncbi:spore coat protein U domain-containing protein [Laribacter hongkongensis]|uniref:spore coat protein U domain-containing protein n=1 Tax=Laribacter hongkongensis TaxID=168471 RepID=UPI00356B66C0
MTATTPAAFIRPTAPIANGTGVVQSYSIYGQITANQYVAPGSYSDTVTVTVTYS